MTAETTRTQRIARHTREGLVTSDKGDKTIRVVCDYVVKHPKYGKIMRRRTVLHAHDEKNEAKVGDTVSIAESRPLSRRKRWVVTQIVAKAASV